MKNQVGGTQTRAREQVFLWVHLQKLNWSLLAETESSYDETVEASTHDESESEKDEDSEISFEDLATEFVTWDDYDDKDRDFRQEIIQRHLGET